MRWTFTANSSGYMFYLDGKPQGGAGTIESRSGYSKPRRWGPNGQAREAASNAKYCREECARREALLAALPRN